jgi:hypothetical protein
MFTKGAKPRTHLLLDLVLFALLVTVALTALLQHTVLSRGTHLHFMVHALHEVAGIAMCLVVTLHLLIHLPWIRSQLPRLFQRPA